MTAVQRRGLYVIVAVLLAIGCGKPAADGGEKPAVEAPAQGQAPELVGQAQPAAEPSQPSAAAPSEQGSPTAPDPILAARQTVPVSDQQDTPVPGDLRVAMEELAERLRAGDVPRVLEKFSRTGGFRYADTRKKEPAVTPIPFEQLAREVGAKGGLYRMLFDPAGLAQYVRGTYAVSWVGIASNEFAPRGADAKQVWVRWRPEGDVWVVDTIAMPAALPRSPR